MSLKVTGTGLGRTGTLLLKHTLERVGFGPCHRMEEVFKNPGRCRFAPATKGGSQ
jgi:hypothetical protein